MKVEEHKMNILCLASSAAQFLIYFKYLKDMPHINYKLIIIDNNDSREYTNYMNNLRQRGMFYITKEENSDFIKKPKDLNKYKLNERGQVFTNYLKDSKYDFKFTPDVIFFSQGGTVNYTIKELFPNNPKLVMYAEWFSVTNMSSRKEWPVLEDKKFIADEWNTKSTNDVENCDAVIVPSQYAKSLWPQKYHDKIYDIFEGIDTSYLSYDRINSLSKMGETLKKQYPNKKFIAYAARTIESTRGFDLWLNAYVKLRDVRDDLHFIVIGRNKSTLSAGGGARNHGIVDFKQWSLEQHGLKEEDLDDITWFEPLSMFDYLSVLKSLDLIIYPTMGMFSNWGFFMSMYMNVPIISSDSSYFPEVIDDKKNGFLVDPYDTDKIVELSLEVLENDKYAKELAHNAHETIINQFSSIQSNIKIINLLDKLLQNSLSQEITNKIIEKDEGDFYFDKHVKSKYGIYIILDDLRSKDINKLIKLIEQVQNFSQDLKIYIGIKTVNKTFYEKLIPYANEQVVIESFLTYYTIGTTMNIMLQKNISKYNIIIDSSVTINSLEMLMDDIDQNIVNGVELVGGFFEDLDSLDRLDIPDYNFVLKEHMKKCKKVLTTDIMVIPNTIFDTIGFFDEKFAYETAILDFSLRLDFYENRFHCLDDSSLTIEPFLDKIATKNRAVVYKNHKFTTLYEKYFSEKRENIHNIFYIGETNYKQAINMFLEYFPNAHIHGCVNKKEDSFERCTMIKADQGNRSVLSNELKKLEDIQFDIIIDNGGHTMRQTQTSLGVLSPYLKSGGTYVIEAMHVCPETKGLLVKSDKYFEADEISTLSIAHKLNEKEDIDISNSFLLKNEIEYIKENYQEFNIEMGKVSEVLFFIHK